MFLYFLRFEAENLFLNLHGIQYFNKQVRAWLDAIDGVEVILEQF